MSHFTTAETSRPVPPYRDPYTASTPADDPGPGQARPPSTPAPCREQFLAGMGPRDRQADARRGDGGRS